MDNIQNFGQAMMASLAGAMALLFAAIPRVIGFAVILVVGWFVASLIAKAGAALLRTVKFDELAERAGFTGFVKKMGVESDAAGFIANLVKWFIRLIVLVVAFDALGLPAVSQVLRELLLWLPNLAVALVVLVIGGLLANAAAKLVRGAAAQGGLGNPEMLAKVAAVAVWAFAIIVAVDQIGVAETLVNTLLMGTIGATALALGLAFGLGGRETAGEIVKGWYAAGKEAKPKLKAAAQAMPAAARQEMSRPAAGTGAGVGRPAMKE